MADAGSVCTVLPAGPQLSLRALWPARLPYLATAFLGPLLSCPPGVAASSCRPSQPLPAALRRASPRREASRPPEHQLGVRDRAEPLAALPGEETPAKELELGVCNLGLHFPGGRARARKCCEPIRDGGGSVHWPWGCGAGCVVAYLPESP